MGEELCIDYVPVKKGGNMRKTVQCDCGSSDCRVRSARVFAFCHSKLISSFAGLDFLTGSRFTCCSERSGAFGGFDGQVGKNIEFL